MAGGWRLSLLERDGDFIEFHSGESAREAIVRGWLSAGTAVIVYDEQGRGEKRPAAEFAQFRALFAPDPSSASPPSSASETAPVVQKPAVPTPATPENSKKAEVLPAGVKIQLHPAHGSVSEPVVVTQAVNAPQVKESQNTKSQNTKPQPAKPVIEKAKSQPLQSPPAPPPVSDGPVKPPKPKRFGWLMTLIGFVFIVTLIRSGLTGAGSDADDSSSSAAYESLSYPVAYGLSKEVTLVNIRSGPGVAYETVAQADAQTGLTAIGRAQDAKGNLWLVVRTASGVTGYVRESLLAEASAPEPASASVLSGAMAETPPAPEPEAPEPEETQAMFTTSFDCGKAREGVEQAICTNASLAAADIRMSGLYKDRLSASGGAQASQLAAAQRAWLTRRDGCADGAASAQVTCLIQAYRSRITELETPAPSRPAPASSPLVWSFREGAIPAQYYPERAHIDGVEGTVVVECVSDGRGAVRDCSVVSETPRGYGFGAAAVNLFREQVNIRPSQAGGRLQPGETVRLSYDWKLPE